MASIDDFRVSGSLRAFPVVADNPEVMPKIFFSSWLTMPELAELIGKVKS